MNDANMYAWTLSTGSLRRYVVAAERGFCDHLLSFRAEEMPLLDLHIP